MTRSQPTTGTFLFTDQLVYRSGGRVSPVKDSFDAGLTGLTIRLAAYGTDQGWSDVVVMLDAYAAARLGLPVDPKALTEDTSDHPAVVELRDAGWRIKQFRPWMDLYPVDRDSRPTMHIGVLPWINRADCPMIGVTDKDPKQCFDLQHADIVAAFDAWADLIGTHYSGTPGWAGIQALQQLATSGVRHRHPTWEPKTPGPEDAYEMPYLLPVPDGSRPVFHRSPAEVPTDHVWAHGYDAKRAYLAAFNSTLLCPWTLKNTGAKTEWSKDLAGWWLIEVEPWEPGKYTHEGWEPNCLPDPAGYAQSIDEPQPRWAADVGKTVRWVTGPTMALLTQLRDEGLHEGFTIHDSWTGPGNRVLRPVYETFKAAWLDPRTQPDPARPDWQMRTALQATFKALYRQTWGMLDSRDKSPVYRPDWHHAVLAQFRANLWRRLRAVGKESGRWPYAIDTDNVYYSAADENPITSAPAGLPLGDTLGKFAHKKSIKIRR
jgi:hypothetical protein